MVGPTDEDICAGIVQVTTVPPSPDSNSNLPPSCVIRSRIPRKPTPILPVDLSASWMSSGMPFPASLTITADFTVPARYSHLSGSTTRMAMHVGQAFLHDSEDGDFHFSRQTTEESLNFEVYCDLAPL